MPMNLNDSPKYGQLSGADMEILGAREQAATARALRTAFKPTQGQMVGGWYVKPTWSQNLADAMMQYNNYKNEQDARNEYKTLVGLKKQGMENVSKQIAGLDLGQGIPAHQEAVPPVQSAPTNQMAGDFFDSMANGPANSTPTNFSPAERAMASNAPMAEAYTAPTAEATGNTNLGATNNQFVGTPSDITASDNVPLANAVRNAPLEGAVAGANNQSALPPVVGGQNIPAGGQASADGTLPAVTVTPEPEPAQPSRFAQMLRGEGEYAPTKQATVRDVPQSGGYSEAAVIAAATAAFQNDQPELGKSLMEYVKERRVNDAAMVGHGKGVPVEGQLLNPLTGEPIGTRQPKQPAAANLGTDYARFNHDTNQWEVNTPVVESKVLVAQAGKPTTNIRISNKTGEALGAHAAKRMEESAVKAEGAVSQLHSINNILKATDENKVFSGFGGKIGLRIAQVADQLGIGGKDNAEKILNTRNTIQGLAQMTLAGRKEMKGEGAITEGESALAERAVSGNIEDLTVAEIQQIARTSERVARFNLAKHEKMLGTVKDNPDFAPLAPFYASGPAPESYILKKDRQSATTTSAPNAPSYIVNKVTKKTMVSTDGEKTWQEVK